MKELEKLLNKQVANLGVLYVKLHNYHWYVKGPQFFALHAKFEELYDYVTELYDEIAERLLALGLNPVANVRNYLDLASIKDAEGNLNATSMAASVANDFKLLVSEFKEAIEVSDKLGDLPTSDMLTGAITELQKHIWMLTAVAA
ncbi:DNA starvation/stationary phase protection protein [Acholeplasma sp. OttesenSCG-928-E16]|nr:DNA starvation/stationary phase protection protein [Acholeplasma sp. OttesenSCG-928-E16]